MGSEVHLHLSEDGADAERIDALAGLLRRELLELDIDDVVAVRGGLPPDGARSVDIAAVGGLLVMLGEAATGLGGLVTAVRAWLARTDTRRTVRIEIDGDVLELSEASARDQQRLVELFVGRHTSTGA